MKLTPKQEKFVQGVVSGLSQREAYKKAGYSSNRSDAQIDRDASVLLKNPKVFQRYKDLIGEHQKKALWTREKAVEELLWMKDQSKDDILNAGLRQANSNAFLNAIKELNQLENLYLLSNEKMKKEIELIQERINQLTKEVNEEDDNVTSLAKMIQLSAEMVKNYES